jgi:hypothetical protein
MDVALNATVMQQTVPSVQSAWLSQLIAVVVQAMLPQLHWLVAAAHRPTPPVMQHCSSDPHCTPSHVTPSLPLSPAAPPGTPPVATAPALPPDRKPPVPPTGAPPVPPLLPAIPPTPVLPDWPEVPALPALASAAPAPGEPAKADEPAAPGEPPLPKRSASELLPQALPAHTTEAKIAVAVERMGPSTIARMQFEPIRLPRRVRDVSV